MKAGGLSLSEIRNMYINEFMDYYYEIVYLLEQSKEMQEGSYDKVRGIDNSANKLANFFKAFKK